MDPARTLNLEVTARGGGHTAAGRATIDGGLMIDLSPMKDIRGDAKARTARAEGERPPVPVGGAASAAPNMVSVVTFSVLQQALGEPGEPGRAPQAKGG